MYLASTPEANRLLEQDALALLIGMLLDQHVIAHCNKLTDVAR